MAEILAADCNTKDIETYDSSCFVNEGDNKADIRTPAHSWYTKIRKTPFFYTDPSTSDVQDIQTFSLSSSTMFFSLGYPGCENKFEWLSGIEKIREFGLKYYIIEENNTVCFAETESQQENILIFPENFKQLTISPESYYTQEINKYPKVKAIVCENLGGVKHFITILEKRDIKAREEIYNIEMKMFRHFPDKHFNFSVQWINEPKDIDMLIKYKEILYFEQ